MVRVSTRAVVVRSHVFRLWSQEAEYATVGSSGLKIVDETGLACDFSSARGPRCGVDVPSLRFLFVVPGTVCGSRDAGAAGASDVRVDQMPTVWSADADRIRDEG